MISKIPSIRKRKASTPKKQEEILVERARKWAKTGESLDERDPLKKKAEKHGQEPAHRESEGETGDDSGAKPVDGEKGKTVKAQGQGKEPTNEEKQENRQNEGKLSWK